MDLILCIVFGLLAAGITSSLFQNRNGISLKLVAATGILSGLLAAFIGYAGGWSDLVLFNLYNVLISIGLSFAITSAYHRWTAYRNPAPAITE